MLYLDSLYSENRRYEVLKNSIHSIVSSISMINGNLTECIDVIEINLKIDENSLPAKKLSMIKNNLEDLKNKLSGLVINEINFEIQQNNIEIEKELLAAKNDKATALKEDK